MMSVPLIVAIPTRERPELLARTLGFLAKCFVPDGFLKVVVVENGGGRDAEKIVAHCRAPFPISYQAIPRPGKNNALNKVVTTYPEAFIIFLDDDIRVDVNVLLEYAKAAARTGSGVFFGGRCLVDYEALPAAWLMHYLPLSAKGWSGGSSSCEIREALGFNWGAFARDILTAGGFSNCRGPGMVHSIGDESEMQVRLIHFGGHGEDLPEALVWHYVPRERCSEQWLIQRNYQHGIASGLQIQLFPQGEKERLVRLFRKRARVMSAVSCLFPLFGRRFKFRIRMSSTWKLGVFAGLEMGVDSCDLSTSIPPTYGGQRLPNVK